MIGIYYETSRFRCHDGAIGLHVTGVTVFLVGTLLYYSYLQKNLYQVQVPGTRTEQVRVVRRTGTVGTEPTYSSVAYKQVQYLRQSKKIMHLV